MHAAGGLTTHGLMIRKPHTHDSNPKRRPSDPLIHDYSTRWMLLLDQNQQSVVKKRLHAKTSLS